MSVRRISLGLSALAVTAACQSFASAVTVFATDFNSTTVGSYADNSVLNSGGITTDNVTLRTAPTASAAAIVDRGTDGSNLALQFTDNSTVTSNVLPQAYSDTFGPLSTTGTGENALSGGFDYTKLLTDTSNATSPTFQFAINSNSQTSASGATAAVQLTVEPTGRVNYLNGTTAVVSTLVLTPGTEYHFEIAADFSSLSQDTWSLTVTPVGSTTAVLAVTGLSTRAPNVAVNRISFNGGVNAGAVNPAAYAQIDNINFSSSSTVPEPASMGLLAAGGLLALRRRSSARRSA